MRPFTGVNAHRTFTTPRLTHHLLSFFLYIIPQSKKHDLRDNSTTSTPFNDEQRRLLANLAQFYDAWISAERLLRELPSGRLAWK